MCILAAKSKGYDFNRKTINNNAKQDSLEGCTMQTELGREDLIFNKYSECDPLTMDCECSLKRPCFCSSKFYMDHTQAITNRRNLQAGGQFRVTWSLNLGGREELLEIDFLKAAFEQSVKDYINNDIVCSDNPDVKGAEFFGVNIDVPEGENKLMAVSGNGKCKGDLSKCAKPVKKTKGKRDFAPVDPAKIARLTDNDEDFCEKFLQSSIFDAFKERLLTASSFNYNVDVGVINDLEGNLDLKYDVSFDPAPSDGLDQVDNLDMDASEPVVIDTGCRDAQCTVQRDVIRSVFQHFGLSFDEDKHECLHQGINCNEDELVTHLWIVNCDLQGRNIPKVLGSLPSIVGLYLGGNSLAGKIPSELAQIRRLKMLWLENNNLSGTIPSVLANLRGLAELNLNDNNLSGLVPTQFEKLRKLKMLNLGKNSLTGPMPTLASELKAGTDDGSGCTTFPLAPFNILALTFDRFGMKSISEKFRHKKRSNEEIDFPQLKSLVLNDNSFSSTIPAKLSILVELEEFNIANNRITGVIPTEIGKVPSLCVLNLQGNGLTGSLVTEIGNLHNLKILNVFGNQLQSTIPTEIGQIRTINEIVLDNNELTGSLPTIIGNLNRLSYFTFSNNNMSGSIPTELGNLEFLVNLDMRGYSVTGDESGAGTLPTELGNMKNWKYVVFEDNGIAGPIPKQIGNMAAAESLWLKDNKLTGTIPHQLSNMENLGVLSLGQNAFEGKIPSQLGKLSGLEAIDVGSNNFTGTIPKELSNCTELFYLRLGSETMGGSIPSEFGNLDLLEYLVLEDTHLTGEIPSELGALSDLKLIAVTGSALSKTIPTHIGNILALESLSFPNNLLTGPIPSEVGNLLNLRKIELDFNQLSGTIPTQIGNLEKLSSFTIRGNEISGSIPTEFGNLKSLDEVDVGNNTITGTLPPHLVLMEGVTSVEFDNNLLTGTIPMEFGVGFDFDTLLRRSSAFGNLLTLDLRGNSLSGTIPPELFFIATSLHIDLGDNNLVGTIPTEVGNLVNLEFFCIAGNGINGVLPSEMGQMLSLIDLDLSGNQISGNIPSDLGQCEQLNTINFNGNFLSGELPSELGYLSNLTYMNLIGNTIDSIIPGQVIDLNISLLIDSVISELSASPSLSLSPSLSPTVSTAPTYSEVPSQEPSATFSPSTAPLTSAPTLSSFAPSETPTLSSFVPSETPTEAPSIIPTATFSEAPSIISSVAPSGAPTSSSKPTSFSSVTPSLAPSKSVMPSNSPSVSTMPSITPTSQPSQSPSDSPTSEPTSQPTPAPTPQPSPQPTPQPTPVPTPNPTPQPTPVPTPSPSPSPTKAPSFTANPSFDPFARVYPPEPIENGYFGARISVTDTLVYATSFAANDGKGAVYVFSKGSLFNKGGDYLRKLVANDGARGDNFGEGLHASLDDSLVAIGAPNHDNSKGKVYLFNSNGAGIGFLKPADLTDDSYFGMSIQINLSNNLIAVGAPNVPNVETNNFGAVYTFNKDTRAQLVKIVPPDTTHTPFNFFGSLIYASFNRLYITAIFYNGSGNGAVFCYQYDGSFVFKLDEPDGQQFGTSIDVHDTRLLIGSPSSLVNGQEGGGTYVYELDNGSTANSATYVTTLSPINSIGSKFGSQVNIDSDNIFISSPSGDNDYGYIHYFLNNDDMTEIQGFDQPDFNLGDQFGKTLVVQSLVGCSAAPHHDRFGTIKDAGMFYIYYFIPQ